MSDKAFISPKVLKWARESARMSPEDAATKVATSPERIISWEDGTGVPTIRQAEILAKAYRRPLALLFLPDIPNDFQPLQDFRRKTALPLGTASIFIIREIQQKQAWISDVYQEENKDPLPFVGKFSLKSDPIHVAENITNTLNIDPLNYQTKNPIREWIDKSESKGIFISRTSFIHSKLTLDSKEIQGFSIADQYAPFVFVNSDDWNAPQLFTLLHEIAHIWINQSGVSNQIEADQRNKKGLHPVELFCNEVAANALMPIRLMDQLDFSVFESSSTIFNAAKKIGVSSFALLLRALHLKRIVYKDYQKLRGDVENDFIDFLERDQLKKVELKKKDGGPSPYLLRLNKNGRLFTQIVLDAYRGGRLEPTIASNLLNTKVNKFQKFENFLY